MRWGIFVSTELSYGGRRGIRTLDPLGVNEML